MTDILPASVTAGLTLEKAVTLTAYPAPDWSLSVILRGPQAIDLTATAEGSQHVLRAEAVETAAWAAGTYWFSVRVTDGVSTFQVDEGDLVVKPDLAAAAGDYDGRGHIQRVLEAIEAVIEGRASKDQERYRINNRELYRTSIGDLLKLRSQYLDFARREKQMANSGQTLLGRTVKARF